MNKLNGSRRLRGCCKEKVSDFGSNYFHSRTHNINYSLCARADGNNALVRVFWRSCYDGRQARCCQESFALNELHLQCQRRKNHLAKFQKSSKDSSKQDSLATDSTEFRGITIRGLLFSSIGYWVFKMHLMALRFSNTNYHPSSLASICSNSAVS